MLKDKKKKEKARTPPPPKKKLKEDYVGRHGPQYSTCIIYEGTIFHFIFSLLFFFNFILHFIYLGCKIYLFLPK